MWVPFAMLILPVASLILMAPTVITRIGPNVFLGIRNAATVRNHTTWRTAHTRAWPYTVAANVVFVVALAIVIIWAQALDGTAQAQVLGYGSGTALLVWFAILLYGARVGVRAVKKAHNASEDAAR